jgi:Tfp pilus assembly protein PilV
MDFTTDGLLGGQGIYFRVEKGDFAGHPFRGNQYQSGYTKEHVDKAEKLEKRGETLYNKGKFLDAAAHFKEAARNYAIAHQKEKALGGVHAKSLRERYEAMNQKEQSARAAHADMTRASYLRAPASQKPAWHERYEGQARRDAQRLAAVGKATEITKGDIRGHVFRGNQHSHGGIVAFDPYKSHFTTTCASGHQNTIRVPAQWIQRTADGVFTGQLATGAQSQSCSTCLRPLANRWIMVDGHKQVENPTTQPEQGFFGMPAQNYVDARKPKV